MIYVFEKLYGDKLYSLIFILQIIINSTNNTLYMEVWFFLYFDNYNYYNIYRLMWLYINY